MEACRPKVYAKIFPPSPLLAIEASMVWYSDEALEAFAIIVWYIALVLFLVALALPCPLCRRNVK
jgi:hypothetical protein